MPLFSYCKVSHTQSLRMEDLTRQLSRMLILCSDKEFYKHGFVLPLARTGDMPDALHRLTCNWILISEASGIAIKVGLFFITNAALRKF